MATVTPAESITSKTQQELEGTPYACGSLSPLVGGTCNYIFRGALNHALPDGTGEVVIKHGEDHVALHPSFELTTDRCRFEEVCLRALAGLPPVSTQGCLVRTPRCYHFSPATNTQVQEYLPDSTSLKHYALVNLAHNPVGQKPRCICIAHSLGTWLRRFHTWAADPAQASLQAEIKRSVQMQQLKNSINYSSLISRIDTHPDVLGDARDTFEQVKKMSEDEMADEESLQIIHGDFWTGNVLLRPNQPMQEGFRPTIFVIDWEMCSFGVKPLDLGQMIAELYELYLYRGILAGLWLIDGFCAGYGIKDDRFAFRTAIHVGTHLVCFGGVQGWGTDEQVRGVIAKGKEVIIRAWSEDKDWFLTSDLACLFRREVE